MKVPMRWLEDYVSTGLEPRDLARKMTLAGLEAEKIEEIGADWDHVWVGEVVKVEQHPNADRLRLADVVAGEHRLTVVTGAPNLWEGQKVALALAGANLVDGHSDSGERRVLKPVSMRGIVSEGMVCSEKELGISDEHEGIIAFPDDAPVGAPLRDYLGDTVIEFEITPNLVHAFSILGIAREAAAISGTTTRKPRVADLTAIPAGPADLVTVEATDLCPRYMAITFEGIEIGPSPEWLQTRLRHAGMRPINNVVDVTNYVMHEVGQPLHAFDRDQLHGGRVVIRRAKPGEEMETLDHVQRKLGEQMLVIADSDRPVGLAGVMGGVTSEVSDATTNLLLEGAAFEMKNIRATSRALKLRSDASARYERGIDPNLADRAMAQAVRLILEVCPNARVTGIQDVYPEPRQATRLSMPFSRIERVIGIPYPEEQVLEVLGRLELAPEITGPAGERMLTVTVPTWRSDISIPDDIVEEVARIVGYEKLPDTLPAGRSVPVFRDPMFLMQRRLRGVLTGSGLSEAVTYVAIAPETLALLADGDRSGLLHPVNPAAALRLKNPLQAERNVMRTTIIPSLVESVGANLRHRGGARMFEMARVYLPGGDSVLPTEKAVLAIAMSGERDTLSRFANAGELDFFDVKGVVETVLAQAGVTGATWAPIQHPALHPGRAASVTIDDNQVAVLGELRPEVAEALGIPEGRVAVAEVDLDLLLGQLGSGRGDVRAPRFLPAEQDFAIVVDETVSAAAVEEALRAGAGPLATGVALFDIYRGPQVGEGRKSLAYRVTFTAPDRALTDAELVKVRQRIEKLVKQRVAGTLRGEGS